MKLKQKLAYLDTEDKRILSLIFAVIIAIIVGSIFGYRETYDIWGDKITDPDNACVDCYTKYHFNYVILIATVISTYCITYLSLKKINHNPLDNNTFKPRKSESTNKNPTINYSTIIQEFRMIAKERGIAPTAKTGDHKIISIYKMGEKELKNQLGDEYSRLTQQETNKVILTLLNIYEYEGEKALNENLKSIKSIIQRGSKI